MQYTRLYADGDGVTHFEDLSIPMTAISYAPPASDVHISAFTDAARIGFSQEAAGWHGDWHPSPRRQYVLILGGSFRVEVGDGEVRDFLPGGVVLLEDCTGRGHNTDFTGNDDCMLALVHLAD
jgi:hypothetical protein